MYNDKYQLKGAENIRTYLYGGHAEVTLQSPSGVHRTYLFKKPRNPESFKPTTLFVYVVTSSGTYNYVGMIEQGSNPHIHHFYKTWNSKYSRSHPIFKGAKYIVSMMSGVVTETPMKLYHSGVCSVCGRKLTNPKSLYNGMGPRCRRYVLSR